MNAASALAVLALGVAAYLGFGIVSASMVIWLKRGDPIAWAVDALTFLVSGILYPVEVLPHPLHWVAALVPATHALAVLRRALFQGASPRELMGELSWLTASAAVLLPLSALGLRWALRKAGRDGSLGQA